MAKVVKLELAKVEEFQGNYYTTTFCNFAHRLKDGKPVAHECDILPPKILALEWEGELEEAIVEMTGWQRRTLHRGLKEPRWVGHCRNPEKVCREETERYESDTKGTWYRDLCYECDPGPMWS